MNNQNDNEKQMTSLDKKTHRRLKTLAAYNDMTLSQMIEVSLDEWEKREEGKTVLTQETIKEK